MNRLLLLLVVFASTAIGQTGPGGVGKTDGTSSLKLWLDAADAATKTLNSTTVSQWSDKSGNANHGTQGSATKQPTNNATGINSRQTITFDGSNDDFDLPSNSVLANNAPCSFFCLMKPANLTGYQTLYGAGVGGGYTAFETNGLKLNYYDIADGLHTFNGATSLSNGTSYIFDAHVNAGAGTAVMTFNLNGANDYTSASVTFGSAVGAAERTVGGTGLGQYWNGDIGEMIIYNVKLGSAERNIVGSYLGAKWGVAYSGSKYGGSTSYSNNVFGIGKESDGTSTSAQRGGLVLSDVSSLANTDYFLAGHDNATGLSAADLTGGDAVKRWTRIWYIDKTSVSSSGNIKIAFDLSDAEFSGTPATASNYRLLMRSGTSGNFSNVTLVGSAIVNTDQVEFTVVAANVVDGYYTLGTTNEGASLLPVELISFEALPRENTVELKWATATEADNYGFEVERTSMSNEQSTINNQQWRKIGFVEGAGSSNAPREYSFVDKNLHGGTYSYRLKQIDRNGNFKYTEAVAIKIFIPQTLTLSQNYPNPFNPSTTIEFTLPEDGRVSLKVFDVLGKEVATLVNGELEAGVVHRVTFDASQISSGIYFFRLEHSAKSGSASRGNSKQLMKKLLVMK